MLGANGQLGSALGGSLRAGRAEVDLASPQFIAKLEHWLAGREVSAVINAAAYTQVDRAEGEGRAEAFRVNAEAVGELARWCADRQVPLVHFSTDYVFDGNGDAAWREDDPCAPLNAYGQSKRLGELAVVQAGGAHLIFRSSWIYDARAKNFFTTMLRLMRERESISVVADQIGAPTYAPQLADGALQALCAAQAMAVFPSGIYHLCAGGQTSWHGFAQAIFALARSADSGIRCRTVQAIPSSAYPLPALRPANSRLDCSKARDMFGVALPTWEEGVSACAKEFYAGSSMHD